MSKTASKSQDQIVFERMEAIHRGAKRGYWVYATLLILLGLALFLAGIMGWLAWLPAFLVGIVCLAVAVLPARDALERSERIEGLGILRDEWKDLVKSGDSGADQRNQFLTLMRRLYS